MWRWLGALLFIALVICDGYLTKIALSLGMNEFNPIIKFIGVDLLDRGIISSIITLFLLQAKKEKLLWVLSLIWFGVVMWNLGTILVYEL